MSLPWGVIKRRLERRGVKPGDDVRISGDRTYWRSRPDEAWKSMALPMRPWLGPGTVRSIPIPEGLRFKH
jgi:hypothetical protein